MTKEKEDLKLTYDFSNLTTIKTGIVVWDTLLGGGIKPNTIQLVGESSSGKTTLALQLVSILCKQGKKVLYVDTDFSIDLVNIKMIGLNNYIDKLFYYVRGSSFKEVEKIIDTFLNKKEISMIVIDSISGLINPCYLDVSSTNKKKKVEVTNYNTNYESRPLGLFIKKYKSLCSQQNITLLLINQYRNKVDTRFGTIIKRNGPKILDYASNTIISIKDKVNRDDFKAPSTGGAVHELVIEKSNILEPKSSLPYFMEYGRGINSTYNWAFYLLAMKIVMQDGTYYESKELEIKENGIENFARELSKNYKYLYEKYGKGFYEYYRQLTQNKKG